MTFSIRKLSPAARRYAVALTDLAQESGAAESVQADLARLRAMIQDSADFQAFLGSRFLSLKQRESVLEELSGKARFQDLTLRFLKLLARNRRLSLLGEILDALEGEAARRRGDVSVQARTSRALTKKQSESLKKNLEKSLNTSVVLEEKADPSILGGAIVMIGSTMVDDSVAGRLRRLERVLKSQVMETHNVRKAG